MTIAPAHPDVSVAPANSLPLPGQSVRERFNRPPRIRVPLPADEIDIPAAPALPDTNQALSIAAIILPLATALLYMVIGLTRSDPGGGPNLLASLPMFGISLLSGGVALLTYRRQRRRRAEQERAYEQRCAEVYGSLEQRLEALDQAQRQIRMLHDPELIRLLQIAGVGPDRQQPPEDRLWERRPDDDDFLAVRVGITDLPTSVQLKPPSPDPFCPAVAADRSQSLYERFRMVHGVPLHVPLIQLGALGIAGSREQGRGVARAILAQLMVHHSPDELRIAACWNVQDSEQWSWLRWLPHTRRLDGNEQARLLACYDGPPAHLQELLDTLTRELHERADRQSRSETAILPRIVVLLDCFDEHGREISQINDLLTRGAAFGLTLICLVAEVGQVPSQANGYLSLSHASMLARTGPDGLTWPVHPDSAGVEPCDALARRLAHLARSDRERRRDLPSSVRLLPLLGVTDAGGYDPHAHWANLPTTAWHAVPLGIGYGNLPMLLDLNEGHHGVHGMFAGTTGSGKSELLLTFLLALAIAHSPDRLNLMLIDFKGGATFADLKDLPHTVGMVTDLEGYMAERALIAINSELDRRKQRLAALQVKNIHDYRKQQFEQRHGALPNLMIAIDEFDEMARDYPEFAAELVRVAKQGRSLGVYLLLVTQQPSTIREGVANNMTYRVALRLASVDDSRAVAGIPDAAYLTTATPGRGFFRVGKEITAFQSARVTSPVEVNGQVGTVARLDATGRWIPAPNVPSDSQVERPSELRLVVQRMATAQPVNYAAQRYPIWTAPLGDLTIGDLAQRAKQDRIQPLAIGLLDVPTRARQEPLTYRVGGVDGHLLVLGAAGAGKTTLLRTLMLAAAQQNPPDQLWMYVIDPGGGACGLATPASPGQAATFLLPHLADALAASHVSRAERLVHELEGQIEQRRQLLLAQGVDTLVQYRSRWVSDATLPACPPALLVVIDHIAELAAAAPQVLEDLKPIMRDAPACGISFVVTGSTYRDVSAIQSAFERRIVLRVNDPLDSEAILGKSFAARIRPDTPGRGFMRTGERPTELQIALPTQRLSDPQTPLTSHANDLTQLAQSVARQQHTNNGLPQPLRELPQYIRAADVCSQAGPVQPFRLPIACDDLSLSPVGIDLSQTTPHFLIAGGPRTGKTSLLSLMLVGLCRQHPPEELQVVLIDYRREVASRIPAPHVRALIREEAELKPAIEALETEFKERRAQATNTPRIVLAVADWELLLGNENATLDRLTGFIAQGRELGLHVLATSIDFQPASMSKCFKAVRLERCAIWLGEPLDGNLTISNLGMKLPRQAAQISYPPGRGYMQLRGRVQLVQCAMGEG